MGSTPRKAALAQGWIGGCFHAAWCCTQNGRRLLRLSACGVALKIKTRNEQYHSAFKHTNILKFLWGMSPFSSSCTLTGTIKVPACDKNLLLLLINYWSVQRVGLYYFINVVQRTRIKLLFMVRNTCFMLSVKSVATRSPLVLPSLQIHQGRGIPGWHLPQWNSELLAPSDEYPPYLRYKVSLPLDYDKEDE